MTTPEADDTTTIRKVMLAKISADTVPGWVVKSILGLMTVLVTGGAGLGTVSYLQERSASTAAAGTLEATTEQVAILREISRTTQQLITWQATTEFRLSSIESANTERGPLLVKLQTDMAVLTSEIAGLRADIRRWDRANVDDNDRSRPASPNRGAGR